MPEFVFLKSKSILPEYLVRKILRGSVKGKMEMGVGGWRAREPQKPSAGPVSPVSPSSGLISLNILTTVCVLCALYQKHQLADADVLGV